MPTALVSCIPDKPLCLTITSLTKFTYLDKLPSIPNTPSSYCEMAHWGFRLLSRQTVQEVVCKEQIAAAFYRSVTSPKHTESLADLVLGIDLRMSGSVIVVVEDYRFGIP